MTAARAQAPTLAWLLTALTCLLAGMAVVESRHQVVAFPASAPVVAADTNELARLPSEPPESATKPIPGPGTQPASPLTPLVEDASVWLTAGPGSLRLARLTLPPGGELPTAMVAGPTVLMVASGILSVRGNAPVFPGDGLEPARFDAVLSAGQRLVIDVGGRYAVRNDGPMPAVALMVAIVPAENPTSPPGAEDEIRGAGGRPPRIAHGVRNPRLTTAMAEPRHAASS